MPTAATVTDVENLTGLDLSSSTSRVEALLERAERMVQAELVGFTFGETDNEQVTLDPDGDELLMLPNYPVRSVSAITVDGTALSAGDWSVDVLGFIRRRYSSITSPTLNEGTSIRWPDRGVDVVVTYSYGYASASTPGAIKDVVVELAAGRIVNPEQVAQESLGDRSVSYGAGSANADGLDSDQRRRLRNWKRHRVGTVRMRG